MEEAEKNNIFRKYRNLIKIMWWTFIQKNKFWFQEKYDSTLTKSMRLSSSHNSAEEWKKNIVHL